MYFVVKGRVIWESFTFEYHRKVIFLIWLKLFFEVDTVKKLKPSIDKLLSFRHQESLSPVPTFSITMLMRHPVVSMSSCYIHFKFCFLGPSLFLKNAHPELIIEISNFANFLALVLPNIYNARHHPLYRAHVCTPIPIFTASLISGLMSDTVCFFFWNDL